MLKQLLFRMVPLRSIRPIELGRRACVAPPWRSSMRLVASLAIFMSLTAMTGWANNCLVIDDFSSGSVRLALRDPKTQDLVTQTGTMLGGVRGTQLLVPANGNPFAQPVELDIDSPKGAGLPLVVTTGLKASFVVGVYYGVDASFKFAPLNYHPTGCDRLRVHFDSFSQPINFNALVFQETVPPSYGQISTNLSPGGVTGAGGVPFCVDLPFSNFTASGIKQLDFAIDGIVSMQFLFGGATPVGGVDFAISKIETVDSATAASHPCAVVLPHN